MAEGFKFKYKMGDSIWIITKTKTERCNECNRERVIKHYQAEVNIVCHRGLDQNVHCDDSIRYNGHSEYDVFAIKEEAEKECERRNNNVR